MITIRQLESKGYKSKTKGGITEVSAPTTRTRDLGKNTSNVAYSPKTYMFEGGKLIKEVDRTSFKKDEGGGDYRHLSYDSNVIEYKDGKKTVSTYRPAGRNQKVQMWKQNVFKDGKFIGQSFGGAFTERQAEQERKAKESKEKREERQKEKEKKIDYTAEEFYEKFNPEQKKAYDKSQRKKGIYRSLDYSKSKALTEEAQMKEFGIVLTRQKPKIQIKRKQEPRSGETIKEYRARGGILPGELSFSGQTIKDISKIKREIKKPIGVDYSRTKSIKKEKPFMFDKILGETSAKQPLFISKKDISDIGFEKLTTRPTFISDSIVSKFDKDDEYKKEVKEREKKYQDVYGTELVSATKTIVIGGKEFNIPIKDPTKDQRLKHIQKLKDKQDRLMVPKSIYAPSGLVTIGGIKQQISVTPGTTQSRKVIGREYVVEPGKEQDFQKTTTEIDLLIQNLPTDIDKDVIRESIKKPITDVSLQKIRVSEVGEASKRYIKGVPITRPSTEVFTTLLGGETKATEAEKLIARQEARRALEAGTTYTPSQKVEDIIYGGLKQKVTTARDIGGALDVGEAALFATGTGIGVGITRGAIKAGGMPARIATSPITKYGLAGLYGVTEGVEGYRGAKDIRAGDIETGARRFGGIAVRGAGIGVGLSVSKSFFDKLSRAMSFEAKGDLKLTQKTRLQKVRDLYLGAGTQGERLAALNRFKILGGNVKTLPKPKPLTQPSTKIIGRPIKLKGKVIKTAKVTDTVIPEWEIKPDIKIIESASKIERTYISPGQKTLAGEEVIKPKKWAVIDKEWKLVPDVSTYAGFKSSIRVDKPFAVTTPKKPIGVTGPILISGKVYRFDASNKKWIMEKSPKLMGYKPLTAKPVFGEPVPKDFVGQKIGDRLIAGVDIKSGKYMVVSDPAELTGEFKLLPGEAIQKQLLPDRIFAVDKLTNKPVKFNVDDIKLIQGETQIKVGGEWKPAERYTRWERPPAWMNKEQYFKNLISKGKYVEPVIEEKRIFIEPGYKPPIKPKVTKVKFIEKPFVRDVPLTKPIKPSKPTVQKVILKKKLKGLIKTYPTYTAAVADIARPVIIPDIRGIPIEDVPKQLFVPTVQKIIPRTIAEQIKVGQQTQAGGRIKKVPGKKELGQKILSRRTVIQAVEPISILRTKLDTLLGSKSRIGQLTKTRQITQPVTIQGIDFRQITEPKVKQMSKVDQLLDTAYELPISTKTKTKTQIPKWRTQPIIEIEKLPEPIPPVIPLGRRGGFGQRDSGDSWGYGWTTLNPLGKIYTQKGTKDKEDDLISKMKINKLIGKI